jgi:DNA processing protein
MRAWKWSFPARNRIMAGLARQTIVVEAAERSGSLITAEFAMDMGRDVGAMPGRVNTANAAGSNRLLQEGAAVVRDAQDILDSMFGAGVRRPPRVPSVAVDRVARSVLAALERDGSPHSGAADAREVRAALGRLEVLGLVRRDGLGGYERTSVRCA